MHKNKGRKERITIGIQMTKRQSTKKRMRIGFTHSYIIQKTKKTSLENEIMNI